MVYDSNRVTPTASDLRSMRGERCIYLWGASIVGAGMCRALEREGMAPAAFLDSSDRLADKRFLNYPVCKPDTILSDPGERKRSFIIITSGHYEDEIAGLCQSAGLGPGVDFLGVRSINPFDPSVDVAGHCNLRCISCPRGNFEKQPPRGHMTPATYTLVLNKLLEEIPLLGNVQLYAWGEPLLNPDIAEIIRITVDRKVLCAISTNLAYRIDLTPVIKAQPDWVKVSASGFGSSYEITHTGSRWPQFKENLHRLSELRERHHPTMYVELNYHLYRHNTGHEFEQMARLCHELGFAFRPNWAYLYPLDHILAYREGRPLTPQAEQTMDMLLLTLDEGIARAEAQAHLPCAEERCLPIAWDGSVRSCGAYFEPTVADNFLDISLSEILQRRCDSGICQRCKRQALHRFTAVYLEEATLPGAAKEADGESVE